MQAEEFRELISKIELAGPMDPKDFIKAILGDQESDINLGDEIKKTVIAKVVELIGPIKAAKSGIIEESDAPAKKAKFRDERGRFVKDPEKVKAEQNQLKIKELVDKMSATLQSIPVPQAQPKQDPPALTHHPLEPKTYRATAEEVTLSDASIKKLSHILGMSRPVAGKPLISSKTTSKSKGIGIEGWVEEIGGAFLRTGLAILAASTFGPVITGLLDRMFGTNITGLMTPFHENLKKWQGWIDGFGKWTTLLGVKIGSLVAKTGVGVLTMTGKALGILPKASKAAKDASKTGTIAKLATKVPFIRKAVSAFTGQRVLTPARTEYLSKIKSARSAASAVGGKFSTMAKFGGKDAMEVGKGVLPKVATKLGSGVLGSIGKTFLKKLPFIGLLISAGIGIQKLSQGDITGGLLDIASGLVSLIPFAGIPLSLAIDVLSAKVTENAGGDKNKKAGALLDVSSGILGWVQDKMSSIYPFKHFIEIGEGINSGDWGKALRGFVHLSPPLGFLLDVFENTSKLAESNGGKLTFSSFFANIKQALLMSIVNNLPEAFGIRAAAAEMLGITGVAAPVTPEASSSSLDAERIKQAKEFKTDYTAVTPSTASSNNIPLTTVTPSIASSASDDIKAHMEELKNTIGGMSDHFAEFSKFLINSKQAGNINITTNNSSGGQQEDNFLSGSRDPIHDWRSDVWKNTILGTR